MALLLISSDLLLRIRKEAASAFPEECCGLLIGERRSDDRIKVHDLVPAANVAPDRRQRFEVDPAVHLRCQRALRGTGRRVVGHYHSHPGGRAEPSFRDIESISDPALIWVIVAVGTDMDVGEIRAWRVKDDMSGFHEIPGLADELGQED